MSYPQFGYTYPSPGPSSALQAASQLLVPGASLQAPSLPSTNPAQCGGPEPSRSVGSGHSDTPTPSPVPGGVTPGGAPLQTSPAAPTPTATMYSAASSLLSYGPAAARMLSDSVYTSAYAAQGYMPFGADPSAFYSPLGSDNSEAWRSLSAAGTAAWPYDPNMAGYPYGTSYGGLDVRRKNATRESTSTLKAWLYEHIKNPYPTKGEKIMLAIITKMTLTQVSTWFANARRRLKKENKMQWSPRNRTGDDDEDKNSDDEDDDVGRDGDKGTGNGDSNNNHNNQDGDADGNKRLEAEDEDIIVDGGNDNDSLLSDQSRDGPSKFDVSGLLRKDTRCTFDITKDPLSHQLSSALDSPPLGNSLLSPLHKTHASSPSNTPCSSRLQGLAAATADTGNTTDSHSALTGSATKLEQPPNQTEKPRIWSLADVATSSTPPTSKRSSPLLGLNLNPHLTGMAGSSGGLGVSPKMPHQTAFTSPAAASSHGFQPWVNGSFNSSPHSASGAGLSAYGYNPLSHHSLTGGGPTGQGHTPGHMGTGTGGMAPPRPNPGMPCSSSTHVTVVPSLTPHSTHYASKLSNGYLGEKSDLPQLPSFTSSSSETHTAFKPVAKRL